MNEVDFDYEKAYNDLVEELIYLPWEVNQDDRVGRIVQLALDMPKMSKYKTKPRVSCLCDGDYYER